MKAGGGVTAASGPSSGQSLNGVNVSLTVNQASLAALRAQIIMGLGTIPITVSAKIAQGQEKAVMAGMITESGGTRAGAAHEVESTVKHNLPQRAAGGPVEARRPVVVGERRPEVFVPHAAGRIEHDLAAYRRREAELASLEYQIQKRRARLERERMLDLEEAKLAAELSGGQRQRALLALATLGDVDVLLLDQPGISLDVEGAEDVRAAIRAARDRGAAVLFASHDLYAVALLADHLVVLVDGHVVARGTLAELAAAAGVRWNGETAEPPIERIYRVLVERGRGADLLRIVRGDAAWRSAPCCGSSSRRRHVAGR